MPKPCTLFFFPVSWDLPNDQNFMYDSVILNFEKMVKTREHCLNLHEYSGIYVIMFNDSKSSILISRDSSPPSTSTYFFFRHFNSLIPTYIKDLCYLSTWITLVKIMFLVLFFCWSLTDAHSFSG